VDFELSCQLFRTFFALFYTDLLVINLYIYIRKNVNETIVICDNPLCKRFDCM
jgi:hypothetical protein